MLKKLLLSLLLITFYNSNAQYNYAEAFQKSLLFADVQRSGAISGNTRVDWRGDSHLADGADMGWDLSGGWYDAGDHVKWNASMSFYGSTLACSAAEYKGGYVNTGQMPYLLDQLRWVGDYYTKCFKYTNINDMTTYKIVIDVSYADLNSDGNPLDPTAFYKQEHSYEVAHEVAHKVFPVRPTYYADFEYPQSGQVAAMAATMASIAYVLRDNGDIATSDNYLFIAGKLFLFASTYRNTSATEGFYKHNGIVKKTTGYGIPKDADPLTWAAIWMHKAENLKNGSFGNFYRDAAAIYGLEYRFDVWNSKYSFIAYKLLNYIYLSRFFPSGAPGYPNTTWIQGMIEQNLTNCATGLGGGPSTGFSPGGLARINYEWGTLRHVNNQAFCAFMYADQIAGSNATLSAQYRAFAKSQLDYALGSNPKNRSYLHGFIPAGKTGLVDALHATARGAWAGFEHKISARPEYQPYLRHTLYGALAGGPAWDDNYFELDGNPNSNPADINGQTEVAIDYNAGFTGCLARMAQYAPGGTTLTGFPAKAIRTSTADDEFYAEAQQVNSGANFVEIRARINNKSRWPATVLSAMSMRYYYTKDDAGTITPSIVPFGSPPAEAALNPQISAPVLVSGNLYYVTVSILGDELYPSYVWPNDRKNYREFIFRLTSSGSWNSANDWSYTGFANLGNIVPPNVATKIPIYNNGVWLAGDLPILNANPTSLTYPSGGSSQNISITSNISWTSISSQPWLTLTNPNGSNNGTISATASANTATGIRTAQVTVSGGSLIRIINITQTGVATTVSPLVFYVSPSGNDSNNGLSPATAWQTATQVGNYAWNTGFNPGDRILFQGNTTINGSIYFQRNQPSVGKNAGLPGNLIILGSYGSGTATISSGTSSGFYAYNLAGYSIDGLNFKGSGASTNNGSGIIFYADASQTFNTIIIKNSVVNGYKNGFNLGEWCPSLPYLGYSNVSIIGCQFHDNLETGAVTYAKSKNSHTNIYMRDVFTFRNYGDPVKTSNSGSGIVISGFDGGLVEYCTAYDNGKNNIASSGGPVGIWAYEAKNIIIQYCESYSNKSLGIDGGGFDLDGGTENCIIQYCYSHDNYGPGFLFAQYVGASTMQNDIMRYNISVNDGRQGSKSSVHFWGGTSFSNCHFYNNTIYADNSTGKISGTAGMIYLNGTNYSGIKVRNNIFYLTGGATFINSNGANPSTSTLHLQDNAYFASDGNYQFLWGGSTYTSLSAWKAVATGQEMDGSNQLGFQGNPMLTNAGQSPTLNNSNNLSISLTGYKLQMGSPLISAGLDLRTGTFGSQTIGGIDFFGNTIPQGSNFDIGAHEMQGFISVLGSNFVNFSASGGTYVISVLSNLNYTLSDNATWLNINSISGSGNLNTFSAIASAHTATGIRTAQITVSGGALTQIVNVTQTGSAANLTASPTTLTYASGGSSQNIGITSNVSWTSVSSQPWLTLTGGSGTNNGTISATASANTATGIRIAQVTVTGGALTQIVNITQTGVIQPTLSNTYLAPQTLNLPVFDGDSSDIVWNSASWKSFLQPWIPYNNILPSAFTTESGTQTITGLDDFSGKYKTMWNQASNELLFLVEITDNTFIDGYTYPNSGYSNFDALELFIDENASGGSHLFDATPDVAANAFAYHMMVNAPTVGNASNAMTAACDIAGTSWGSYTIEDYKSHFPNFSMKNMGNGKFMYEFSLKTYNTSFVNTPLTLGKKLGFSFAYCDNDQNDGFRDHFIGSVTLSGANNNNSYIDASIFGTLSLTGIVPILFSNPSTLTYNSGGFSQNITITSNLNWTSVSSQPWLTLTNPNGTNNGTISATASANTATGIRTAQVTVSGGALTQIVNITQTGAAASLVANPTTLTYSAA
ncbi:MAG: hypothetical protein EAZ07_00010, partial [Cytophagales bacterium]